MMKRIGIGLLLAVLIVLDNAEQLGRRNQLRQALRALDKAMRHRCLHVM